MIIRSFVTANPVTFTRNGAYLEIYKCNVKPKVLLCHKNIYNKRNAMHFLLHKLIAIFTTVHCIAQTDSEIAIGNATFA